MARKLKTYQASLGFFDTAIAAPSMKAALEAWGSSSNLFHQGVAKEVTDPKVIAATMAKPGIILKRPVGSNGPFTEHAHLPKDISGTNRKPEKRPKKIKAPSNKMDEKAAREAALAFEKEERRRAIERRKEDVARAKEREQTRKAQAKAQLALDKAEREHEKRASKIETQRDALEKRSRAEQARWEKQRVKLSTSLRRATR